MPNKENSDFAVTFCNQLKYMLSCVTIDSHCLSCKNVGSYKCQGCISWRDTISEGQKKEYKNYEMVGLVSETGMEELPYIFHL